VEANRDVGSSDECNRKQLKQTESVWRQFRPIESDQSAASKRARKDAFDERKSRLNELEVFVGNANELTREGEPRERERERKRQGRDETDDIG
jgi:hypothetical protein